MHWMNPAGAWALTALAAILFLYILKQKTEPLTVSSTYLWQKALASMEADRPFQKLRRNLLLFMQLLLALLLALSLMRPMTLGGEAGEVVFVFDLSASMQADGGDGTRLDLAIEDAKKRLAGLPDGARASILTAGAQVKQPLARSDDSLAARRALDALQAENGGADLDGALSLAIALQKELTEAQVVVYTDQPLPEGDFSKPSVGPGLDNLTILSLNATDTAAVARVANYGAQTEAELECYADGRLCDVRTLSLLEGEIASVQFDLPGASQRVEARLIGRDALEKDNTRLWVARDKGATTVVLAGRDNVFVEKALALRSDVTVVKTTPEEAAQVKGGSLTVLDGPLPEALPERGALLLIDPDARVGALESTPAALSPALGPLADLLNEFVQVSEIQVARWRPVVGGMPVWTAGGQPVLSVAEEGGRRVAVIGFDLHESNLPLLKEFPIFMQRLLAYLAPEPLGAGFEDGVCGAPISVLPQSFARSAEVRTPSGRVVSIPVTGGTLTDTDEIGLYTLVQTDEAGVQTSLPFALHIPSSESDVRKSAAGTEQAAIEGRGATYGREWTPWLIALLLLITLLEWWVYRRGY